MSTFRGRTDYKRSPDIHCWVDYCGANCCTELIKVDEEEGDENG